MALDVEAEYRRYGPMVLRRCRFLLRDEALAQDAMHDVFVRLLEEAHRLTQEAPSSLLHRMATHVCLNRLRGAQVRARVSQEVSKSDDGQRAWLEQIASQEDLEARGIAASVLRKLFAREVPSTAYLAVSHFVDGRTYEDIAREVNLSVSGVRKRLRTLKARLDALEPEVL